jgi:glycosyltransferase involved in cell wall biosynthesis
MAEVAVVIPAFRAEATVQHCVDAVCRSTIRHTLRIIVVDDGGNPQLARRLRSYPVTIVATNEVGSAAYARDLGSRHADSEILLFLDADVIVEPDAIEKLVQPIRDGEAHATVGNYSRRLHGLSFAQSYKQLYVSHIYSRRQGYITNEFWTALGAVKTSAYRHVRGFNTSIRGATGEDVEFGIRLTQANYQILQRADAVGQHRHPFTLVKLLKNDLVKGMNLSRNFVTGTTRVRGNRHSSTRDIVAVLLAGLVTMAFPVALLASLSLSAASIVGLLILIGYCAARADLLNTLRQPGAAFLFRSLPLMFALDLVRGISVALSILASIRWRRRSPGTFRSSPPPPSPRRVPLA